MKTTKSDKNDSKAMSMIENDLNRIVAESTEHLSGRRILIAGGAGFLGSWLCDATLRLGAIVTCIDNMSTGKMQNIRHLLLIDKLPFKFLNANIEDVQLKEEYDYIFHFASRVSPEEYQQHPIETLKANSLGTMNMLSHALKSEAVFIYASSSEVYGDAQVIPTPENYWGNVNPIGARSCYDEGKRFGEALCVAYSRQLGLDTRIARIFNTFGPRIRADGAYARALPRFIMQVLRNEPITVYGDGNQTRSFCYVSDTITGILRMALRENLKGEVVNIGDPHEITINQLAETIRRISDTKSEIIHLSPSPDDPRRRKPDISKAMKLLQWSPRVELEKGIRRTIEWFKNGVHQ